MNDREMVGRRSLAKVGRRRGKEGRKEGGGEGWRGVRQPDQVKVERKRERTSFCPLISTICGEEKSVEGKEGRRYERAAQMRNSNRMMRSRRVGEPKETPPSSRRRVGTGRVRGLARGLG